MRMKQFLNDVEKSNLKKNDKNQIISEALKFIAS
jgi:hypothetical protein